MATTARARRTSAPKADTQAEVPAKASIWTRVKTSTKKVAVVIAKPFKAIAKFVRRGAVKAAVTARAAVSTVIVTAQKAVIARPRILRAYLAVRRFAARLWLRSIRPLLLAMMYALAIVTAIVVLAVGFTVAPLATAIGYIAVIAVMFGIAHGLRVLETREANGSVWAQRILNAFNFVARGLGVLAYVATAIATVAMSIVSLSFAVFIVLDIVLSYFEVRGATTIAFLASCVISGQWELALAWLLWRVVRGGIISDASPEAQERARQAQREQPLTDAEFDAAYPEYQKSVDVMATARAQCDAVVVDAVIEVRPSDAPNNPETWTRGNYLIAKGTEELWGTEHDAPLVVHDDADEGQFVPVTALMKCSACACGHVNLVLSRTQKNDEGRFAYVCEECYAAESEDLALRYTGVSLTARSIEVRLNKAGIEASDEYALSRAIATGQLTPEQQTMLETLGWVGDDAGIWLLVAEWRDKNGREYPREWACLYEGVEVACVRHERKRNVYTATVLGEVASRTWNDAGAARRAANRQLRDYESSVAKKVTELSKVASEKLAAQGA